MAYPREEKKVLVKGKEEGGFAEGFLPFFHRQKSLDYTEQMTERLSVSTAKSSSPSSSSHTLDNQGLDKQVSHGKKKKR